MKSYFINEALHKAINDYMSSKENKEGVLYNSFLVVVIRMLVNIYGELDITNPYITRNIFTFDNNLMKYGIKKEEIDNFKRLLDGYYVIDKKNKGSIKKEVNTYFILVQKCLIDFFVAKAQNYGITNDEEKEFFDLLYTPGTSNYLRLSYNFKEAEDQYEIANYYQEKMSGVNKEDEKEDEEKNLLGFDVYKLFNLSINDLSKMDNEEINKVNKEIYKSLDISENALNKEYLLNEKIKAIKVQKEAITTGNGYVDILLIMSVIVTTLMVVIIFSTLVF